MADPVLTAPSRRATLIGAVTLASVAVSGGAEASPISPAVQKAFDAWQAANAHYKALERENEAAHDRGYALLPERQHWARPISAEQQAAITAALQVAGAHATDEAAIAALDLERAAFLKFVGTAPQSMVDVRLQAKHMYDWLEVVDVAVEQPVIDWLEVLIGGGVA